MEALNKTILDFSALVTGKRGFPVTDKIDLLDDRFCQCIPAPQEPLNMSAVPYVNGFILVCYPEDDSMHRKAIIVLIGFLLSANAWAVGEVFKLLPNGRQYCGNTSSSKIRAGSPPEIFARINGLPGTPPGGTPVTLWADANQIVSMGDVIGQMYQLNLNYQVVYGKLSNSSIGEGTLFAKLKLNKKGRVKSMRGSIMSDFFSDNGCFKVYDFKSRRVR